MPSSASAISVVVTRGDCANGGGTGRRGRRVATFHFGTTNVTSNKIWDSTMEVSDYPKSTAANASRICGKCGSRIFADAPQGFCGLCLFKTGLGPLGEADESLGSSPVAMPTDFEDYELLKEIRRGGTGTDNTANGARALLVNQTGNTN